MNAPIILLGAVLGGSFVALTEWLSPRSAPRVYGAALVVASLVYVGFAAVGGAPDWVSTELGGALVFAAVAVAGVQRYPVLLAAGWTIHVGWDLLLHGGIETPFAPEWYVFFCVGFDLLVAGAMLLRSLPRREVAETSTP